MKKILSGPMGIFPKVRNTIKKKKSTDTYRIIRGHTQIWNFSATVQLNISRSKQVRS